MTKALVPRTALRGEWTAGDSRIQPSPLCMRNKSIRAIEQTDRFDSDQSLARSFHRKRDRNSAIRISFLPITVLRSIDIFSYIYYFKLKPVWVAIADGAARIYRGHKPLAARRTKGICSAAPGAGSLTLGQFICRRGELSLFCRAGGRFVDTGDAVASKYRDATQSQLQR